MTPLGRGPSNKHCNALQSRYQPQGKDSEILQSLMGCPGLAEDIELLNEMTLQSNPTLRKRVGFRGR
jgi:hypothetical protein